MCHAGAVATQQREGVAYMEITTLGIDLAKSVFQLHGVDAVGAVVLQKKLRRGAELDFLGKLEPCLIGMEACATSHHWAREIAALGHDVRLFRRPM
jgi:transposase